MKFSLKIFLVSLATVMVIPSSAYSADGDLRPVLKINRDKGDQCVEPTADMRKNHMKYLLHQRDETVHEGIRTKKHSLKECIACHANKDDKGEYIPVNTPGEFCQTCHAYASVKIDCFECHATKPRQTAFHPIVTQKMKAYESIHAQTSQLLNNSLSALQNTSENNSEPE